MNENLSCKIFSFLLHSGNRNVREFLATNEFASASAYVCLKRAVHEHPTGPGSQKVSF